MKHLYLIHFIVFLCFTPDITLAQVVWGDCPGDISCQPTLYQVYGTTNPTQAQILSYDSNLGIPVNLFGSYPGFLNAVGYSSARNRAYAIGCTGVNPNICNGLHELVEIGIDDSAMPPTANFCVKGVLDFSSTNTNCLQGGYLQQGDIVSWNISGDPVEALVFRSGSGQNDFLNYVVVYDPGNQLGGPSLNVTCVPFGNIALNANTTNVADLAYAPGINNNKLFGVNPTGELVIIDGPIGNNWTADITQHTVNTIGNRFVDENNNPLATQNGFSFGAVYISKDSGGNLILMCTDNTTGNSFRSSINTTQILSDLTINTNPWQWQLFTSNTQGGLSHNDGFSCPTAEIITCNLPPACEFILQPVSSSPEDSPEDSCRFKASVFSGLDEFGNLLPVPYDFEWDITVDGVSEVVYQGYDLQTVWFNVPMNSKIKEICLTLSDPNDPTCFIECCKDIICDCPVEVSSFENFDANLTRLTAVDSIGDCCYEICPSLLTGSAIDPDFLCVSIDWGDGGPFDQGTFNSCFQHCYLSGTSCDDIACHEITVYAYCCQNEANFLEYYGDEQPYPYAMTWTGDANCCPLTAPEEQPIDCYIRNAFWVDAMWESVDGMCTISFSGTQFLGIDMVSHNSPVWSLPSNPSIEATASGTFLYDNFTIFAPAGTYQVCRSLNGLAVDGSTCSTTSCHDVVVNCGSDAVFCSEDLNGDGNIGVDDLLALLGAYGASCE